MSDKTKQTPQPEPHIIREGGYQPTSDPGPVPTSLVRPSQSTPSQSSDKK